MVNIDMSVNIGSLILKNPIITASGTYGYDMEYDEFLDINKIGAITTKAITLEPRCGNPQPRIAEVKGGMINCIGLENLGVQGFIEKKLPVLKKHDLAYIVNVAGSDISEYIKVAKILNDNSVCAIELNVSCPNVKSGCLEFGKDKESLYSLVSSVREVFSGTMIVKLTPNLSNPSEIAYTAKKAGADALSAINTVKSALVSVSISNKKFHNSILKGGLSGPCIKPIALGYIHEIKSTVDIPIIGMGGIYTLNDMLEFFAVGSDAVQLGTANFTNPEIAETLADELEEFMINNGFDSLDRLKQELKNGFNN